MKPTIWLDDRARDFPIRVLKPREVLVRSIRVLKPEMVVIRFPMRAVKPKDDFAD